MQPKDRKLRVKVKWAYQSGQVKLKKTRKVGNKHLEMIGMKKLGRAVRT